MQFVHGTNESSLKYLWNSFLNGNNNYPRTLHDAYKILQWREQEVPMNIDKNDGLALAQWNLDHIVCYNCNENGHYASQCPNHPRMSLGTPQDGANMAMLAISQEHNTHI